MADVAVKTFEFRIAAVYTPNTASERRPFLRRLGPFLDALRRRVLVGDWNAILDPYIDRVGRGGDMALPDTTGKPNSAGISGGVYWE